MRRMFELRKKCGKSEQGTFNIEVYEQVSNLLCLCVHHYEGRDESVETEDLGENEDQNHANVQFGLLRRPTNTRITNNANGHTGRQTRQTDCQTSAQIHKVLKLYHKFSM